MIATWPVLVSACSTSTTRGATAMSGSVLDSLVNEWPSALPVGRVRRVCRFRPQRRRSSTYPAPKFAQQAWNDLASTLAAGRGWNGCGGDVAVAMGGTSSSCRRHESKWQEMRRISGVNGRIFCACTGRTSKRPPKDVDAADVAVGPGTGAAGATAAVGCVVLGGGGVCDVDDRCVLRIGASGYGTLAYGGTCSMNISEGRP